MNKCFICISIFLLLFLSVNLQADIYGTDDNTNQDTSNTSNVQNPSTTTGSGDLLGEMQKKTEKALKTFKNLTGKDQSKQNFFADEGSTPTSSELEGPSFGDSDTPDETEFKLPGSDKGGPF